VAHFDAVIIVRCAYIRLVTLVNRPQYSVVAAARVSTSRYDKQHNSVNYSQFTVAVDDTRQPLPGYFVTSLAR